MHLSAALGWLVIFLIANSAASLNSLNKDRSTSSEETASAALGELPQQFDARSKWPLCPSIGQVWDEGCCDASYAIAPTSAMTDRTCILSNGTDLTSYSALESIVCCDNCASLRNKCHRGDHEYVWKYWIEHGITSDRCLPYSFHDDCTNQTCPERCAFGMQETLDVDRRTGARIYYIEPSEIQREIYYKGPVTASVRGYRDFLMYDGQGVFRHRRGIYVGDKTLKLIGWGSESDGTQYWLAVFSAGTSWGDRGTIKFLRGYNHAGIEENVWAGEPVLKEHFMFK